MKKNLMLIAFTIVTAITVQSQNLTQTVRGSVIDVDSKLPLVGVAVVLTNGEQHSAITDEKGKFKIEKVPVGRVNLQLFYLGYEPQNQPNIEVNSGKEVFLELAMQESVIKLDEVVVKANRSKGEATNDMAMLSARSISLEETNRYTGGMNDPSRVVSSFAGVASTPDGSSDIIVRGNSPKYMQWRIDGIEISSPYHMDDQNASFGALTALNNNLLATSDFYTGAFSPEYGNVLSSVFDVKLRPGNNEKFEASFGVGILGTDVTLEGPFKKGYAGSYLINYRYSTVSLIKKLGLVDVDGIVNYQDATFKVVLPTKKTGTFSFFGLGGLSGFTMNNIATTDFSTPGKISNADIRKDYIKSAGLSNFGLTHTITINNNSFVKTTLSYSANGFDDDVREWSIIKKYNNTGEYVSDSLTNKIPTFYSTVMNSSYKGTITYSNKINSKNKIQVGIKYVLSVFDYNQNLFDYNSSALLNVTDFNKSAGAIYNFISWKYSLNENITFVTGLHNTNILLNNKSTFEPRIAINWKINSTNSVHAGYGKHSTMESVHNYFTKVTMPNGTVVEPNKNLDLLKANHYVLGYETRFTENLMAKIEAYYQDLYNLPVENNDTSYYATINEGYDYRYVALVNKGTGKNYGLEMTVERFFDNNYYYMLNGSLFNSTYKTLDGIERNTQYNGNFLFNFLCGKEFKKLGKKQNRTLALNLKVFFGGGKKYLPLLRDAHGNVAVDPVHNNYWDYKKAYDKSLDDAFSLNFSVSYKINKPNSTQEIFLDLINLTDNKARMAEYYDESKPGKVGYLKQFGFFPNFMYKVYF
jgi:hypothetical protein